MHTLHEASYNKFFLTVKEDLFEGDIKLTPQEKAALLSGDASVENWKRAAQKWQRDHIPYVLDGGLCKFICDELYYRL